MSHRATACRWTLAGGAWRIEALPSLGGNARAFDVDDAGNVVGWSYGTSGPKLPVVWEGGTSIKALGRPKSGEGLALGISATGRWVVGCFQSGGSNASLTAARWRF